MSKRCLREPIRDIFAAAELLDCAVCAHLAGEFAKTAELLTAADIPLISAWTESIWGRRDPNVHRIVEQKAPLPHLSRDQRPLPRMPDAVTREAILLRDGYHCRFCGIPVVPAEVRQLLNRKYPTAARWGARNVEQHAALQCMWLQFDHLIPNERGGTSDFNNVIVTCAPCNFGRMQFTIEEMGLDNPLDRAISASWSRFDAWDGLTRLLN